MTGSGSVLGAVGSERRPPGFMAGNEELGWTLSLAD